MARLITISMAIVSLSGLALRAEDAGDDQVRRLLSQGVTLKKGFDPNTPLEDALEYLSDHYQINFVVDVRAFEKNGMEDIKDAPVRIRAIKNVPVARVLQILLQQVKGAYQVRKGCVIIFPRRELQAEVTRFTCGRPRSG
jgi:hypothetical protein